MKTLRFFCSIPFLLLTFYSCIEEQNFDQTEAIVITPTVEASIFYFETTEQLINDSPGIFYSNDFNFDAFKTDYFSDKVIEGSISFQLENTTSKPARVTIELVDDDGVVLDTIELDIEAEATETTDVEIFYGGASMRSLDIIRNTSGLRLSADNLGDNSSVSSIANPKLIFRSSARFKVRVR